MMGEKKAQNVYWKEREKVGCKRNSDLALLPNKRSLAPMNLQGSNGRDGLGKVNQRKTVEVLLFL
jgi:hypothetical protein